jgi:acetyl-CoA synthetase
MAQPHSSLGFHSEFSYDKNDEAGLNKELTLQVRKVIGPFAAPKKIYLIDDLPKTRSGKVSILSSYYPTLSLQRNLN